MIVTPIACTTADFVQLFGQGRWRVKCDSDDVPTNAKGRMPGIEYAVALVQNLQAPSSRRGMVLDQSPVTGDLEGSTWSSLNAIV